MIRALGAGLVLFGGLAWGLQRVHFLRRRQRLTEALAQSLHRLGAELTQRLTPLPELLLQLQEAAPPAARGFFAALCRELNHLGEESFGVLWGRCVERYPDPTLDGELRAALTELGWQLGRYAAPIQGEALARCTAVLERSAAEGRQALEGNIRLQMGLCVCAALAAVVILL